MRSGRLISLPPLPLPAEAIDAGDDSYDDDGQEDGEDDPNVQLLTEYYASFNDQDGYNPPYAPQPLTSDSAIDGPEVLTPTYGYNISHGPQTLSTDDGYNPDPSLVQNANYVYHPSEATLYSPVTPPYSSENFSLPLESPEPSFSTATELNEDVDTSNVRCHTRTLPSPGRTENSKAEKSRKRS
jgi:hypothetical protein